MTSSKIRVVALAGIAALLIVLQVLYDPISSARHALVISRVRAELPQARAKWELSAIKDYSFEIQGDARSICQPSAIVEVRDDEVVEVQTKDFSSDSPAQLLAPENWADPDWGEEVFLCSYLYFTMPRIFDLVEQTLHSYPSSIMYAYFDPQYGFVTDFSFGIYTGYGLMRPKLSNCCNEFQIRNFKPLTDQ